MSDLVNPLELHHDGHRIIEQKSDGPFNSRRGCLDCDEWIEPVTFKDGFGKEKMWKNFLWRAICQKGTGVHEKTETIKE